MTPEQIVQDFDALTVENAYATINYDLHHREEVEAYLQTASEDASRSRDEMEKPFETTASELSFLRAGG